MCRLSNGQESPAAVMMGRAPAAMLPMRAAVQIAVQCREVASEGNQGNNEVSKFQLLIAFTFSLFYLPQRLVHLLDHQTSSRVGRARVRLVPCVSKRAY